MRLHNDVGMVPKKCFEIPARGMIIGIAEDETVRHPDFEHVCIKLDTDINYSAKGAKRPKLTHR